MGEHTELDLTPDYKRLFDLFMEEARRHSLRVAEMEDREELRHVQGMIVALTIAAGAISGREDLTAFRLRMEEISARLDEEGRQRDEVEEWPTGHHVRILATGEDARIEGVVRGDNGIAVSVRVGDGWARRFHPDELEYVEE